MTGPRGELPILPVGTQVVTTSDLRGDAGGVRVPRGALGTVLKAPTDATHAYWVRLVGWLAVGLVIYFAYSRHHSRLMTGR